MIYDCNYFSDKLAWHSITASDSSLPFIPLQLKEGVTVLESEELVADGNVGLELIS